MSVPQPSAPPLYPQAGVNQSAGFTFAQKIIGISVVVAAVALTIFVAIIAGAAALAVGAVSLLSIGALALIFGRVRRLQRPVVYATLDPYRGLPPPPTYYGNVHQVPGRGAFVSTPVAYNPLPQHHGGRQVPGTGYAVHTSPVRPVDGYARDNSLTRGQSAVEHRGSSRDAREVPGIRRGR